MFLDVTAMKLVTGFNERTRDLQQDSSLMEKRPHNCHFLSLLTILLLPIPQPSFDPVFSQAKNHQVFAGMTSCIYWDRELLDLDLLAAGAMTAEQAHALARLVPCW